MSRVLWLAGCAYFLFVTATTEAGTSSCGTLSSVSMTTFSEITNGSGDSTAVGRRLSLTTPTPRQGKGTTPDFENNTSTTKTSAEDRPPSDFGLMSAETKDFAINILGIVSRVILPLALLVTVCNVVVFAQKSMRSSTSMYILGLSVSQIFYLLLDIGYKLMMTTIVGEPSHKYGFYVYNIAFVYLTSVFRRASYVVMCLVSTERIYAIVRPLHVKTFVLVRHPLPFICGSYLVTACYHFYTLIKLDIKETQLPHGEIIYYPAYSDFYTRNEHIFEPIDVSAKVLFSYLPLLLLTILNLATLFFLRRHNATRQKMKTSSSSDQEVKRQRQMTVTILGATIGYVVLSLPLAVHSLFDNFHPLYHYWGRERNIFLFFQDLSFQFILLSCFTDFLSFLLLSSAYRRTFCNVFRLSRYFGKGRYVGEDTVAVSISDSNNTLTSD
ncbi:hypothetical protein BaRGS_00030558 [Batillaria attramentaria]|uniref:G-protein coupled receptors family 1 profile domain-containing protein n=1 Tax=Batillaria attramentaria TaxID=370345 RepID=A0ABD0JTD2_9CAEN